MTPHGASRFFAALLVLAPLSARAAEPDKAELARKAQAVLKANCYRCHGQEGAVEGGMNYVLDLEKLVQRKKVVPGQPDKSPLFKKIVNNVMPPPNEKPRPGADDVAILKQWIEAGAPRTPGADATGLAISERAVIGLILADLEKVEPRARRFQRYFTLAHLYNAGLGEDELQTYRAALAKLMNSLSWHPRITRPVAIDPARTVLRIDLRDFMWDANLWNRLLAEYPFGVFLDTADARSVAVATASRMPVVRADWFIATASRAPLYYELLQIPGNLTELERNLRVDVAVNIQQERVARAGFNGSGVSRNNRILERHDAVHGAYWRTYDFEPIPQNLVDRQNLLPDRRNLFAYPLGPGNLESQFQHAGGEVIFNLPNGLQAYVLVNANNQRIDKANTAIVSDPKRPDRAVEAGVSCMSCHFRGILPKADQVRDYVQKNPKAFSRADADLIKALYVPEDKMKALMDGDADRFQKAVTACGARVSPYETVMTMTLRYEADLDLPAVAAELSLTPKEFLARLEKSELLARNFGSLKVEGGTVQRQVLIQAFGDMVKELRLGTLFQSAQVGQSLPDNTGEIDPLESRGVQANSMVFTPDGRYALFASADKTVRLWDIEANRELRRFVGHTHSVWSVAVSADGKRALSGGADNTVRLWDVETGREIKRLEGHTGLVTGVAFTPDGKRALSCGFDASLLWWDLENLKELSNTPAPQKYVHCLAMAPDGRHALLGGDRALVLWDARAGKEVRRFERHTDAVISVAVASNGKQALTGSDDGTLRLWDLEGKQEAKVFTGHGGPVKAVAFGADGKHLLSGSSDATLRVWDAAAGKELGKFTRHTEPLVSVAFTRDGKGTLSGSTDAVIHFWSLAKVLGYAPKDPPATTETGAPVHRELKPAAVVRVGATLGSLLLAPDGKSLYYLNTTANTAGRIDLATLKRDSELKLAEGAEVLALSPNGKHLYALARKAGPKPEGTLQVIDPLKLAVEKTITFAGEPFDAAAADNGLVYVTGGGRDWSEVSVIDTVKADGVVARFGGVWNHSFVRLAPAQDRLFVSLQGVTPATLDTLLLPETPDAKPVQYKSPAGPEHPLGGGFVVSPDGKLLLCRTGTVLRLSSNRDDDLKPVAKLEPFLAAAVVAETNSILLLTADGSLKHYAADDFKPRGTCTLGAVGYRMALDGKQGKLYVAAVDPQALADRPRGRGVGDVYVYNVAEVLGGKSARRGHHSD